MLAYCVNNKNISMLVPVPFHLEALNAYSHKGEIEDVEYLKPWIEVPLNEEKINFNEPDYCFLTDGLSSNYNLFEDDNRFHECSEINTEVFIQSLDSLTEDDFNSQNDFTCNQSILAPECFNVEPIQFQNYERRCMLEELISLDFMVPYLKQIPHFDVFLQKLVYSEVKDPFVNSNGYKLNPEHILSKEHLFVEPNTINILCDDSINVETFDRVATKEINSFEDCLDYKHVDSVDYTAAEYCKIFKSLEVESLSDSQQVITSLRKDIIELQDLEHSPSTDTNDIFLNINEYKESAEFLNFKQYIFEEPIINVNTCSEINYEVFEELKLFTDLTDSEIIIPNLSYVESKIWNKDKFYDPIFDLLFDEPSKDIEFSNNYFDFDYLVNTFTLELQMCDQELNFMWNPMRDSLIKPSSFRLIEHFICPTSESPFSGLSFYKIDTDLTEDSDDLLDLELNEQCNNFTEVKHIDQDTKIEHYDHQSQEIDPSSESSDSSDDPFTSFTKMRCQTVKPITVPTIRKSKMQDEKSKNESFRISPAKKNSASIIEIHLSETEKELCTQINSAALPYFERVKQGGHVSQIQQLTMMNSNSSRFTLKEYETSILNGGSQDQSLYHDMLCLHALLGCRDELVHTCLRSALEFLKTFQEKYESVLGDSLNLIRNKLFISHHQNTEKNIYHSKISTLIQTISSFRQRNCLMEKEKMKFLILIQRNHKSLIEQIISGLSTNPDNSPVYFCDKQINNITKSNENCLIMMAKQINKDFPFCEFSLVIDYEQIREFDIASDFKQYDTDYIGFRVSQIETTLSTGVEGNIVCPKDKDLQETKCFATKIITSNKKLLVLLEKKYKFIIYECDFESTNLSGHFVDVIFDQTTGVVIQNLSELSTSTQTELLLFKLKSFSLKFTSIFIIFFLTENETVNFDIINKNIAKIYSVIIELSKCEDFVVKFVYSYSDVQVAEALFFISKQLQNPKSDLEKIFCPKHQLNHDELLLLQIPSVNLYSACLLLSKYSISELITMKTVLRSKLDFLPSKVLNNLNMVIEKCKFKEAEEKFRYSNLQNNYDSLNSYQTPHLAMNSCLNHSSSGNIYDDNYIDNQIITTSSISFNNCTSHENRLDFQDLIQVNKNQMSVDEDNFKHSYFYDQHSVEDFSSSNKSNLFAEIESKSNSNLLMNTSCLEKTDVATDNFQEYPFSSSCNLIKPFRSFTNFMRRKPAVASVTPIMRNSTLDKESDATDLNLFTDCTLSPSKDLQSGSSPPLDLSEDEIDDYWLLYKNDQKSDVKEHEARVAKNYADDFVTNSMKRRKLTYTKVEGSRDGQTQLNFI